MRKVLSVLCILVLLASVAHAEKDTRTLNLSVWDRIKIVQFLPQRASFEDAVLAQDIKDNVELTQEEMSEYNVRSEGSAILWDQKGQEEKPFQFTYLEMELLKKTIDEMSRKKEISVDEKTLALIKKIKAAPQEEAKDD